MDMARVSMDFDCNTTPEWIAKGGFHVWKHFAKGHCQNVVDLSWGDAESLRGMAKGIPGWNSGQVDHPHPLKFEDTDV